MELSPVPYYFLYTNIEITVRCTTTLKFMSGQQRIAYFDAHE